MFDEALFQNYTGFGDYNTFLTNVRHWTGSTDGLQIVSQSSLTVDPRTIIETSGKARMISIDGGHTAECACSDMHFSEAILHPKGVAVVDDFFNVA